MLFVGDDRRVGRDVQSFSLLRHEPFRERPIRSIVQDSDGNDPVVVRRGSAVEGNGIRLDRRRMAHAGLSLRLVAHQLTRLSAMARDDLVLRFGFLVMATTKTHLLQFQIVRAFQFRETVDVCIQREDCTLPVRSS